MDRLLSQLLNQFMRMFMGKAIDKGINHFAGGGKAANEQTPEERARVKSGKDLAGRAQQVQKILRKLR